MLKAIKIVGLNSDIDAALAFVSPKQPLRLFAMVACSLEDAFSKSRQALIEAESAFYASSAAVSEALAESLEAVQKSLSQASNLQILLAATSEDEKGTVLYLLGQGSEIKAYLFRNDEQTDLYSTSPAQLVSGILQDGDRVVIATQTLTTFLGEGLDKVKNVPLENLEDEVSAHLPEAESYPVSMIVLEQEIVKSEPILENVEEIVEQTRSLTPFNKRKILPFLGALILFLIGGGLIYNFAFKNKPTEKPQGQVQSQPSLSVVPETSKQADLSLWLDLDLIKQGFSSQKISFSLGNLLLYDVEKKVLLQLNLKTKSQKILAGGVLLGKGESFALNGDIAWLYASDKGILKIGADNKVISAIRADKEWEEISDIYGFANNIYLLDQGKIWKYVPIESGYSDKIAYFKGDQKTKLGQVLRMQIDSSVWLLLSSGQILKYTQGIEDFFSIGGLDKGIKDPKSFFISDKTDYLYILDSGNNRLVILDKKGQFQKQYLADQFKDFSDLIVDEQEKKAYFLAGSKIYWMELK